MLLKTIKYPWKAVGFLGGSLREIWRFFEVFETSGTGGSLNSICCFSQRLPGLNNGWFEIVGIFKYMGTGGYHKVILHLL
jgi:hypothetical protein